MEGPRGTEASAGPCWASQIVDRIIPTISAPAFAPRAAAKPSIRSIPRTSSTRLAQEDACPASFPDGPIPASTVPTARAPKSILYLAYGSNLCAETFLGRRGIRPLSQINVSAPSLRLTFDLPGLPYAEPCFANTAPRKIPKLPDPPKLPPGVPHPPVTNTHPQHRVDVKTTTLPVDAVWDNGLIGVVYEVTPEDFAKIVATEGGGASYADILVPCLPLPPRMNVPEKPEWPELPKMFVAHTLYAPRVPNVPGKPGDGDDERDRGDNGDEDDDGKWKMPSWMRRWMRRLIMPVSRPEEDYAQPSARYLKLIRDGAREHELPDDYQKYLAELKPYTITSPSQRIGMMLLSLTFGLLVMLAIFGGKLFADESGRVPRWLAVYMAVVINLMWMTYDNVLQPIFGDGERTEEVDHDVNARRRRGSMLRRGSQYVDEENKLLKDW